MKKRGYIGRIAQAVAAVVLLCMGSACGKADIVPAQETEYILPESKAEETAQPDVTPAPDPAAEKIAELLASMSVEEKVGQMFIVRCPEYGAAEDVERYHLGGFVLYGSDFKYSTPEEMRETIASYQAAADIPLIISVDEEGGSVNRISKYSQYRESPFKSPRELYAQGGYELIEEDTREKCALLGSLGVNTNLAPVADLSLEPWTYMYSRSFGIDASSAAEYVRRVVEVMGEEGTGSVLKHYPGYGNADDSHVEATYDDRPLSQLETDALPFIAGIEAGADAVLVSHNIVYCFDEEYPASVSYKVHRQLREELGFDGVIMTDDLFMDAIRNSYGTDKSAVMAVLAGNDMICSTEYQQQISAVIEAVQQGRISEDTLDRAVSRILAWKIRLGLIQP